MNQPSSSDKHSIGAHVPKYPYAEHDEGIVLEQPRAGEFTRTPMTPAQLAAREPALAIAKDIYRHANQAGVCYYEFWLLISKAIQGAMDTPLPECGRRTEAFFDDLAEQHERGALTADQVRQQKDLWAHQLQRELADAMKALNAAGEQIEAFEESSAPVSASGTSAELDDAIGRDAVPEPWTIQPIGYAVRMQDGHFVGIWQDRKLADAVCAKQPPSHGDTVIPVWDRPAPVSTTGRNDAEDARRYREVKACDWIELRVAGQEFVGVSNLDAWADARSATQPIKEKP